MGLEGLAPSRLVFGILPRAPALDTTLPAQKDRMGTVSAGHLEMATSTAKLRIRIALHTKTPPVSDFIISTADRVRFIRESSKALQGTFTVVKIEEKQVFVDCNGRIDQFSIRSVVPEEVLNGDNPLAAIRKNFSSVIPSLLPISKPKRFQHSYARS